MAFFLGCESKQQCNYCENIEEFDSNSKNILEIDAIQGGRVTATCALNSLNTTNRLLLYSHTINVGKFNTNIDQTDIGKLLLGNGNNCLIGGTADWVSSIRYETPKKQLIGRYISSTNSVDLRANFNINENLNLQDIVVCSGITNYKSVLSSLIDNIRKKKLKENYNQLYNTFVNNQDLIQKTIQYRNCNKSILGRVTLHESPIASFCYTTKFPKNIFIGLTSNIFLSNGAVINTYGTKLSKPKYDLSFLLSTSPNFEANQIEGLKSITYNMKSSLYYRLNHRQNYALDINLCMSNLRKSEVCFGFEHIFSNSKFVASLNNRLVLSILLQRSNGLEFSGSIDYLEDTYKCGFSYEMFTNLLL